MKKKLILGIMASVMIFSQIKLFGGLADDFLKMFNPIAKNPALEQEILKFIDKDEQDLRSTVVTIFNYLQLVDCDIEAIDKSLTKERVGFDKDVKEIFAKSKISFVCVCDLYSVIKKLKNFPLQNSFNLSDLDAIMSKFERYFALRSRFMRQNAKKSSEG